MNQEGSKMLIKRLVVGELATNCYLLGCEGTGKAAIVDPGADGRTILEELALGGWQLDKIILTHGHYDHFGAASVILAQRRVPVAIGKLDAAALHDPNFNLAGLLGEAPGKVEAELLLEEGDSVEVGNLQFQVLHTPGHTPGGICLQGEGVLLTGDTLFRGSIGRTDFPGGSPSQINQSLERFRTLPGELQVLPGHGPTSTIAGELLDNPFLG